MNQFKKGDIIRFNNHFRLHLLRVLNYNKESAEYQVQLHSTEMDGNYDLSPSIVTSYSLEQGYSLYSRPQACVKLWNLLNET